MPPVNRIQFSKDIAAPADVVWHHITDPESYRYWTAAFAEGSRFEGGWHTGASIRFLSPSGDGMVSEIAESRRPAFISIRHLGVIANGVEDTTSDAVRAWAPAYENYTLLPAPQGTRLVVDQDVAPEWEAHLKQAWLQALDRLQALCETAGASDPPSAASR